MRRLPVLLLIAGCAAPPPAPKPELPRLTVARIYHDPPLSGKLLDAVQWHPDSTRLSYIDGSKLMFCDAATGARTLILDFARIGADEEGPAPKGIGRAAPGRYWWNPAGDA